jgi:hypothetical protein
MLLAWLDPPKLWNEVNPLTLGVGGVEPPMPSVEEQWTTACIKEAAPSIKERPLFQVGLYEKSVLTSYETTLSLPSITITLEILNGFLW